jgi:hypothetical protein
MKPRVKILVLLICLMLPYMAFVLHFVSRLPEHPLPGWFPYVAACYFFGSILLATVLNKRIAAGAPPQNLEQQKIQRSSSARAARMLGYIWLLGPVFYFLSGGPVKEPAWVTVFGLLWVGFLSWASFRTARRIEMKAGPNAT